MTDGRTLGEILAEALNTRTYSFKEEVEPWFDERIFKKQSRFGSATVMERGEDLDLLLYAPDTGKAFPWLLNCGWKYTGTEEQYLHNPQDVEFHAFRRGCWNLVVVEKVGDYYRMVQANDLCVKLRLENKEDRIAVFDSICGKHNS